MSSKPSFRVKLSRKRQENLSPKPPTTITFAIPGTSADRKLQKKLQRESTFNTFHVQESRLAEWNVNMLPNTSALPIQTSTTIACGLSTPQTLLNPLEMGDAMETEAYEERKDCLAQENDFPLTPAASHEFALASPISLSRVPLCDSEAADVLLSLFCPRFKSIVLSVGDNIVVDSRTNVSASSTTDTPSFFISEDDPSNCPHCADTRGLASNGPSPGNTTLSHVCGERLGGAS